MEAVGLADRGFRQNRMSIYPNDGKPKGTGHDIEQRDNVIKPSVRE